MAPSPTSRSSTRYAHAGRQVAALSSLYDDTDADGPTLVRPTPPAHAPLRAVPYARFEDRTEVMPSPPCFEEQRAVQAPPPAAGEPARRRISGIVPKVSPVVRHDEPSQASKASFTGVHTRLLTLSPAFLAALKQVAPKKRRIRLAYVFGLAVVAVVAALGADGSTRNFLIEEGERVLLTR